MKRIVMAAITAAVLALPIQAQITFGTTAQEDPISSSKAKYLVVVATRVPDYRVSYLMSCAPDHPDCNTVYRIIEKYIPLESIEDVQTYLANSKDIFVKLFVLAPVEVTVKESETKTPQPPVVTKKKTYIIGGTK